MMFASRTRIVVFAKAPIVGLVKTRLIPALGAETAMHLHCALLRHTLATVCSTSHPVELWCSPDSDHVFFSQLITQLPVTLHNQTGVDLGERMAEAFADALTRSNYVLIIGSDCPAITQDDIETAFVKLRERDAVLGPATDGGYWLIGLYRLDRLLFEGVNWGSSTVLNETLARLRQLDWRWQLLSERSDVDRPEDLNLLPTALRVWQ